MWILCCFCLIGIGHEKKETLFYGWMDLSSRKNVSWPHINTINIFFFIFKKFLKFIWGNYSNYLKKKTFSQIFLDFDKKRLISHNFSKNKQKKTKTPKIENLSWLWFSFFVTSSLSQPYLLGGVKWKNLPDFSSFSQFFPSFLNFSPFPQLLAIFRYQEGHSASWHPRSYATVHGLRGKSTAI